MTNALMFISYNFTFPMKHLRWLAGRLRCVAHNCIWYLAILFRSTNCYSSVYPSLFYYFPPLSIGIYAYIRPIAMIRECLSNNYLFLCISSLEKKCSFFIKQAIARAFNLFFVYTDQIGSQKKVADDDRDTGLFGLCSSMQ